jgi:2-succinyl-5-enolpyruvyl-6-hydroxy-3-cyclohexene-1-carboxylate synthase
MYTNLKSYQIIIALLKKYDIRHLVLSAGSRNVPFVHSVEEDDFFTCYSVVDERSAAYFAMGLSQQIQQPVLISCTASTASSNYWPAIGEAFYQGVPIIVLTSDRNPTRLHQWEDQMIDQVGMFDRHVKKSVNLPIINDDDDWLYCQRLVNEALLELDHNGAGPVHINVPMKDYSVTFNTATLPEVRKIDRIQLLSPKSIWEQAQNELARSKRILVTCGQQSFVNSEFNALLSAFFKKYNCVISTEHMSNVKCEGSVNTSVCFETRYLSPKLFAEYKPDIVISYGNNIFQGLKQQLLSYKGEFRHWSLQPDGQVVDMYNSLTTIFECPPSYFFNYMVENADDGLTNDMEYYQLVKGYSETVKYPEFDFSSTYAIQQVVTQIPAKSILHMAINNSIRISNFFEINSEVRSYANIGTYGIDGSLSTLIGQSTATKELCFMIIGDLSFFYDMNCLRVKHIGNNVRILLVNNEGGGEFYYNGSWINKSSDLHTTARHHTKAEGWVKENNFIYLSAHDKASFEEAMKTFMSKDLDKSVFLEVFSEMKKDSDIVHDFYNLSRPIVMSDEIKSKFKGFAKSVLPNSIILSIKK